MTVTIRRLGISLSLLLAVLGTGCSEAAPEPLLSTLRAVPALTASDLSELARFSQPPAVTTAQASKWIGPRGGRLELMGFAIDVPAGAVDRSTLFTLRLPVDLGDSEHVVAEFGPQDVRFKRPVTVELPFHNTSIEGTPAPGVVSWDGQWVRAGGTVSRDGERLRTTTDQFSTYGTAAAQNGAIATSGG